MNRLNDVALLILRAGVSLLMMTHGWGKLEKLLAGGEIEFYDFIGLGPKISLVLTVLGEFIAPIFILFGLFTRWAALPVIITMGVAAFMVHAGDPVGDREGSLMYLICYLAILMLGPGAFSVDQRLGKKR
jgi:putative oxidoreductase